MPEQPSPKLRPSVPAPAIEAPATGAPPYAELDVTSNFSFLRGASHPDEMVYRAAELGHRAIAITDLNTLAGVVRAHEAAKQSGVKLLIGARLSPDDGPDLLVWATDRAAYGRLCRLLTLGKRRAQKGQCQLKVEDVVEHSQGLLAALCDVGEYGGMGVRGSAPARTPIPPHSSTDSFAILKDALGPRLSLAVSALYGPDDQTRLERAAELSRRHGIPLLATNHVHYHDPSRRLLQDVLTCVRHGCTIQEAGLRLFPNGERYLKPPASMHAIFADYPQAIHRGIQIADRCAFSLDELRYEYPDEVVPAGRTPLEHLADLTWRGAEARYPQGVPDRVRDLLQHELKLIEQLRFEPYFLTVHDLVVFARSRGILCQGRGSAANSAVCYCLGVTSVDPARIDLLFERFISAARGEPPDIDIDFEHERREEVLQYIYEKYGRERAGMTAEIISYRGRSAVRDVGKAMGLSLDMVDQMARKLDWWERGTIGDDRLRECGLDPSDRTVRLVVQVTSQLLGFPRHLSQHVGGMVMTRGALCDLVPIENAAMENRTVIEWDKDDIDTLGILKVDCLGLGMLTCIGKAMRFINEEFTTENTEDTEKKEEESPSSVSSVSSVVNTSSKIELHAIPAEDPAVYDMICQADTVGVFQIESRAQMSMLPRLRPRCYYDLVIEVALVRPGPIVGDMVHPYLRRRNGEEPVVYPSEAMRQVLARTLGVPLFQEQAMRLAIVGAGFTPAEADQLRRAMAAWKRRGGLDRFGDKFIGGMLRNGYSPQFAQQCFKQLHGFSEYGFPESHAASFALLAYASAWLKRYHPAAFAAALLNSQPMGFYAPAQIVRDARDHGVEVRPADVNHSDWDCTLEERVSECGGMGVWGCAPPHPHTPIPSHSWGADGPAMRLGLRQLKGMRESHAPPIVEARKRGGAFGSIAQFHQATALPVSCLRLLAEADAFASLGLSRRKALWEVMELKDDENPLFDESATQTPESKFHNLLPPMPIGQEVMIDYLTTGLSLKRHPVDMLREELNAKGIITSRQLASTQAGRWVKVCGLVLVRQRPATASGVFFFTLEDETGVVNLIVRPGIYERYRAAARHSGLLMAQGMVERQGQVIHVMVHHLTDLSPLLSEFRLRSRDFH